MVRGNWGELTVLINQLKILNDLLGGRGWWLVKGDQVRVPFLFYLVIHQIATLKEHYPLEWNCTILP